MGSGEVLVTGASGLLGRALTRRFAGGPVTAVSKSGAPSTIPCDLEEAGNVAALFDSRNFSLVLHAAAYSDVDGCENDPSRAHRANALGTRHLALECAKRNIPLIYISTDYVFDGRKDGLYRESDPTCPINVYGMTKLEGEHYARLAPTAVIVRTSWLFGGDSAGNFVNVMAARLKKENVVSVLDDQIGAPTCVEDLSRALERIASRLLSPRSAGSSVPAHSVFHVCNSGSTTRYAMTVRMKEILGLGQVRVEKGEKAIVPGRVAIRPRRSAMSPEAFERFSGMRMRPWEESLKDYLRGAAACAR